MPQTKNQIGGLFRSGHSYRDAAADEVDACSVDRRAHHRMYIMFSEVIMKVVLIDNPKFISGILRKIFGIKKNKGAFAAEYDAG